MIFIFDRGGFGSGYMGMGSEGASTHPSAHGEECTHDQREKVKNDPLSADGPDLRIKNVKKKSYIEKLIRPCIHFPCSFQNTHTHTHPSLSIKWLIDSPLGL